MKNKRKKGFTLIELLAIIVILAIIAVITVPIILNVIDNARVGSIKDSAYGYKDAINKYYVSELLDNSDLKLEGTYTIDNGKLGSYEIPFTGTIPTGGYLTYENNILTDGCITMDEYKVTVSDGEVTTVEKGSCGNPITGDVLEKKLYVSGDAIENYGGYNWHVIGDDGTYVTLMMDLGENGNLSLPDDPNGNLNDGKMNHCTNDLDATTDCGVDAAGTHYLYSWDKSLIKTYLNDTFYKKLEPKIGNEIIPETVCIDSTISSSRGSYLKKSIERLSYSCSNYENYNVRLLSNSEYHNIKPGGNRTELSDSITMITVDSAQEWLYAVYAGTDNTWWTMGVGSSHYPDSPDEWTFGNVYADGSVGEYSYRHSFNIRPVITVAK